MAGPTALAGRRHATASIMPPTRTGGGDEPRSRLGFPQNLIVVAVHTEHDAVVAILEGESVALATSSLPNAPHTLHAMSPETWKARILTQQPDGLWDLSLLGSRLRVKRPIEGLRNPESRHSALVAPEQVADSVVGVVKLLEPPSR